jgi:hypothetical protein
MLPMTQEERAEQYEKYLDETINFQADNGDYIIVGFSNWEFFDFSFKNNDQEHRNHGYMTISLNKYDGVEATTANGEIQDCGDFLTVMTAKLNNVYNELQDTPNHFYEVSADTTGDYVFLDWTWTGINSPNFYVFSGDALVRVTSAEEFYHRVWQDGYGDRPTVGPGEYTFTVMAEPTTEGATPESITTSTVTVGKLSWSFDEAVRNSPYSSTHFGIYLRKLRSYRGTATTPVLIYTQAIPGSGSTDTANFSTIFDEAEADGRMFAPNLSDDVKTAVAQWHGIAEGSVNDSYVWEWITDPYCNQFSVTTCQLDDNDDPIGESVHSNLGLSTFTKTTP